MNGDLCGGPSLTPPGYYDMPEEDEAMKPPTREQIAVAFLSVLDGMNDHDIKGETGLPDDDVHRIIEIRQQLQEEIPDWHKRAI